MHDVHPSGGTLRLVEATVFDIEQAGCESCAALVRDALGDLGTVLEIAVDESADLATVRLVASSRPSAEEVDRVLREASPDGHAYRIRPGSWRSV